MPDFEKEEATDLGRSNLEPLPSRESRVQPSLTKEVSYPDGANEARTIVHASNDTQRTVITFHSTDPENPDNWPPRKKYFVVFSGLATVMNSTLGSSLPSGAIDFISADFNITNEQQVVLPISIYLVGYVLGPLLCGPLSEQYGRKPVMVTTFLIFTLFTMACALAPNFASFLVFRLICGAMASAPIAVVGGLYADVYHDPSKRGYAMAYFMAATTFGPCLGPSISGFISTVSWRWTFWLGLMFAGVTMPFVLFMPETYVPVLLQRKASKLRAETGNQNIIAKSELDPQTWRFMVQTVLTRPFRMLIHESIVLFTCIYLSLAYAVFYLYFQAYPLIFQGPDSIYHMTPGIAGLAFLPIGVGACICAFIFFTWDTYLTRSRALGKPWTRIEEYRRLPLACFGGPAYVVALFWLGWSSYAEVHWIVPMLSGVLFGVGFLLIFMAMLNYLTDAYETFAASAAGIASTCRSIFGALLPLAASKMYGTLGIHWASSLLAFLSLGMAIIPFAFIRYGERIRAGSKFCNYLKEMKEKEKEAEERESLERREGGGDACGGVDGGSGSQMTLTRGTDSSAEEVHGGGEKDVEKGMVGKEIDI